MDELTEDAAGPEIPAPLDEPAERLSSYAKTLVLERGIQLENAGPDGWRYRAKGSKPTATLSDITSRLDLRIVRITIKGASSRDWHFLVPTTAGRPVLEMQVQELGDSILSVDAPFAHHVRNLAYIAEATAYHCSHLVDQYVDVLDAVTRHGQKLNLFSEDFIYSGAVTAYFEFEALVTSVVRAYDTARFPLWSAYGMGGTRPSNFERVVARACVPEPLEAALGRAVTTYNEAKRYRDCIQHYAHFGARLPFARIQLREGLAWSALALLPDNPEAKAYDKFNYTSQIDALSYGWSLTVGLLRDLATVVAALPMRPPNR